MSRAVAARVVPFGVFIALIALGGPLASMAGAAGLDGRWLYAIRSTLVAALLAWFWSDYTELRPDSRRISPLDWTLAVIVGGLVIVLWVTLDFSPLSFGASGGYNPRDTSGAVDWGLALTRAAGSVLVVPIMEELFWRSFITRWLERQAFLSVEPRELGLKAVALGALLFGAEHYQWFAGVVAGLGYAWLYVRTGNLWTAIVAHAVSNALLSWWVLRTGAWHFW